MSKSKAFRIFSISFISGIALVSFCYPFVLDSFYFFSLLIPVSIGMIVFYENKKVMIAGLAILMFISGGWLANRKIAEADSFKNNPQSGFSREAEVVSDPVMKDGYQDVVVRPIGESYGILLRASPYQEFSYGEVLNVSGALEVPKNMDDKFDYRMYLVKEGIFYVSKKPDIRKTGKNDGSKIFFWILEFKKLVQRKIASSLPVPESGLLEGLIIGGSASLPKSVQEDFSRTGTTHIVAVSGYNVTIVAEYLMMLGIAVGLWRRQSFWFATFGIAVFVFMCGLPASAVRAGVMGVLILWAMKNGRLANSGNAILFAASVMLIRNPLLLRYDAGFQLSFLATAGVIYFYPLVERYSRPFMEGKGAVWKVLFETLALTFSAQMLVLPILMYSFGSLSIISLLVNLLILPIISFSMMLGFFAISISFIFHPVAMLLFWLAYIPLRYEIAVVGFFSGLKYASIEIADFPWWGVAVWYIMLFGLFKAAKIMMPEKSIYES
ncbi:MAG: ComEC family competence protein [Candidatus Moranbacteria bacterium]|nr:ComEC family competence protein [Candidatus Moranbacteria bacterium]